MNRSKWLLLGALATVACRDLDYPEGEEAVNAPPEVTFLSPAANDVVTLNPIVSLTALDPNGVADVTLYCGGVPIFVWTAPPYLSNVDLSSCPSSSANNSLRDIELRAIARDVHGLASEPVNLALRVDVSVAALTVSAPQRVAPGTPLVVRIQSDRPLGAIPTVRIASTSASVVERTDLQTQALTVFDATFTQLPGLASDVYDAGTGEIPLEVLEQLERSLLVEVEGRATSGNVSRVVTQVLLSRIAWTRALPVSYEDRSFSDDSTDPVANEHGLTLPVGINPQFSHDRWITLRLAHEDGQFFPFSRYDLVRDGGYSGEGIDENGNLLMTRGVVRADGDAGTDFVYVDTITGAELATGAYPLPTGRDIHRASGALCTVRDLSGGFCGQANERELLCLSSTAGVTQTPFPVADGDITWGTPFNVAVSGGVFAGYGWQYDFSCNLPWNPVVFAAPGGAAATSYPHVTDPADANSSMRDPSRLFPLSPGTFVATSDHPVATPSTQTYVVDANGVRGASFFTGTAAEYLGQDPVRGVDTDLLVAGRPDGSLVTLRHDGHSTVLERWLPDSERPTHSLRLSGYYLASGEGKPEDIVFGDDGSMAILLVVAGSGMIITDKGETQALKPNGRDLVLGIDPQFRAKWAFRPDPRADGVLVGNGGSSHIYYVDLGLQQVTALTR